MAYIEYLARDYSDWLYVHDSAGANPAAANPNRLDQRTARSLQAVLIEVEQASVFIAVSTSVATALLSETGSSISAWHLQSYGPAEPQIFPAVAQLLSSGLNAERLMPVLSHYARLGFAQRLSRSVIELDPAFPIDERRMETEKLEDAWRHVCATAIEAATAIRTCLEEAGYQCPPVANASTERLLRAAEQGECPCVDTEGNVTVPGWAENRSTKRHTINQNVEAYYRGQKQTIILENASAAGLGLRGLTRGMPGRVISIALEGGETVAGMIAWDRDGRTGVKLDAPLAAEHPLLAGRPKD